MKAAATDGRGGLRVVEADLPEIPAGGARVRVAACGVCGSDAEKVAGGLVEEGRVLGHEVVGRIEEGAHAGRRVALAHHVPCGECRLCRGGHSSLCRQFVRTDLDPGGFAEHLAVSPLHLENAVFSLPEQVGDLEGTLLEPLSCVLRALDTAAGLMRGYPDPGVVSPRGGAEPGGAEDEKDEKEEREEASSLRVLVAGCGSVGLLFLSVLAAGTAIPWAGAGEPAQGRMYERLFLEPDPERAGLARALGASALTEGGTVDLGFVTAPAALPEVVERTASGGVIVVFAADGTAPELDLDAVYRRELTLAGVRSGSPAHLRAALGLLASGSLDLGWFRPRVTDLAGLPGCFADYIRGKELKVVVRP